MSGAWDTLLKTFGIKYEDSSVVREHDVKRQASAVKDATAEGLVGAVVALACSSATVLGACKLFPAFNRSLSVSGKTALIVTPAFGTFFLLAELRMNEHKRLRRGPSA